MHKHIRMYVIYCTHRVCRLSTLCRSNSQRHEMVLFNLKNVTIIDTVTVTIDFVFALFAVMGTRLRNWRRASRGLRVDPFLCQCGLLFPKLANCLSPCNSRIALPT